MSRFLGEPVSIGGAVRLLVIATAMVVVGSGALMRLVDHHEYPNVFRGMWWALQTVTTVGYGDVTPARLGGRIVAGVVMFGGIALLAVVTAAVTSTFVERAREARQESLAAHEQKQEEDMDRRLADLAAGVQRVEASLQTLTARVSGTGTGPAPDAGA